MARPPAGARARGRARRPVLATVLWLDRHEAEPPHLLAFAFGWGACVASLGALVLNTGASRLLDGAVGDVNEHVRRRGARSWRRCSRGWASCCCSCGSDGSSTASSTASCTRPSSASVRLPGERPLPRPRARRRPAGLPRRRVRAALPRLAVRAPAVHDGRRGGARDRRPPPVAGAPGRGALCSVSSSRRGPARALERLGELGVASFVELFLLLQVPVFAPPSRRRRGRARVRESRLIVRHLQVYARTGWLGESEVAVLASSRARRQARSGRRRRGGRAAAQAVREFQETVTELAFRRDRLRRGRWSPRAGGARPARAARPAAARGARPPA